MKDSVMGQVHAINERVGVQSPDAADATRQQSPKRRFGHTKQALLAGLLALVTVLSLPTTAHAGIFGVFDAIFGLITGPIGGALKSINEITQETQKLYQQTMWPLALINQARGFVSGSITGFRGRMTTIFYIPVRSATLPAPQQFESVLHSRDSSQLPVLQNSFHTNFGTVPVANVANPQDRLMMDMDDSLGEENLKATIVADQGEDAILATANAIENQVATTTPGFRAVPHSAGAGCQPSLPGLHAEDACSRA
jgi:hypothetical protein